MEDAALLHNLSRSLNWHHTLAEWRVMADVGHPFMMRDAFRCYGTAMLTPYSAYAVIGMVLVARDRSGMGLGTATSGLAIRKAHDLGIQNIVLFASHEAESMYRKLGFEKTGSISVLTKPRSSIETTERMGIVRPDATGEEIARKYYEDCPGKRETLRNYLAHSKGVFYSERENGELAGFAGSFVRIDATGNESLAVGPFLADNASVAGKIIEKLVAHNIAMTCFALNATPDASSSCRQNRQDVRAAFTQNGFMLADELPFMTYRGRAVPLYSNPAIIAPISLALG